MKKFFISFAAATVLFACNNTSNDNNNNAVEDSNNPAPTVLNYQVIKVYSHDTSSYTEGLEWRNNKLYESGGNYGSSKVFTSDVNGNQLTATKLSEEFFGEGLTLLNNKIYQLTWRENKVFVYDAASLKKINELSWPNEGWGMTNDNKNIIISTGSSNLYYVNPDDFKVQKIVGVFDNYGPVANINELEYVDGYIYANQYESDYILKINPATGKVEGRLDLKDIRQNNKIAIDDHQNVLNGIAYNPSSKNFYVTGKLWPALFEIRISN